MTRKYITRQADQEDESTKRAEELEQALKVTEQKTDWADVNNVRYVPPTNVEGDANE